MKESFSSRSYYSVQQTGFRLASIAVYTCHLTSIITKFQKVLAEQTEVNESFLCLSEFPFTNNQKEQFSRSFLNRRQMLIIVQLLIEIRPK